jgi:hypothetical protein
MSDVYTNIKGKNSTNYIFEPSSTDVTSIVKIIAATVTSIGYGKVKKLNALIKQHRVRVWSQYVKNILKNKIYIKQTIRRLAS